MEECKLLQLPPELLLWIGSYLPFQSLALLCFQSKPLRSIFADRLPDDMIVPSVLLWAAEVEHIPTMRLALNWRPEPDVNITNSEKRTPLSFVAEHGDITTTRRLLQATTVDIYGEDIYHPSPLSWAAKMGHSTVVDLLVAADVENIPGYIEHAINVATWHRQAGIVETLLTTVKNNLDFCDYGKDLLCSAAEDGEEEIVELYLAAGIDHNACDGHLRSALCLASGAHGGVMKLLIAKGADVNMRDRDGQTPLMQAVEKDYDIGVEILLGAKGIDTNVKNVNGDTALSLAKLYKHKGIVKLLCAAERMSRNTQAAVQLQYLIAS
jgi:ankyrin repeat protein